MLLLEGEATQLLAMLDLFSLGIKAAKHDYAMKTQETSVAWEIQGEYGRGSMRSQRIKPG